MLIPMDHPSTMINISSVLVHVSLAMDRAEKPRARACCVLTAVLSIVAKSRKGDVMPPSVALLGGTQAEQAADVAGEGGDVLAGMGLV